MTPLREQTGSCYLCGYHFYGKSLWLRKSRDHVVPKVDGGVATEPAHVICNWIKGRRSLEWFRQEIGSPFTFDPRSLITPMRPRELVKFPQRTRKQTAAEDRWAILNGLEPDVGHTITSDRLRQLQVWAASRLRGDVDPSAAH